MSKNRDKKPTIVDSTLYKVRNLREKEEELQAIRDADEKWDAKRGIFPLEPPTEGKVPWWQKIF